MAYLKAKIMIHLAYEVKFVLLVVEKVIILAQYSDFVDVILTKVAIELSERSDINKDFINLEPDKQPFYDPIYYLKSVKLEILKAYIKINLVIALSASQSL